MTYDQIPRHLNAYSYELPLTHAAVAEGWMQKNRKIPISAAAMQLSTAAACVKRSSCESAFKLTVQTYVAKM